MKISIFWSLLLSFVRKRKLPKSLSQCYELELLHVGNNKLLDFSADVFINLKKLRELQLYKNKIQVVPPEVGNLKCIKRLSFASNQIKGLPEEIGSCTTLEEFDGTDKNIALQIVSGREGISLRKANALVYYNIDFSATSYWQSRDRMTTKDRLKNEVYWIFSKKGIEKEIYKAVIKKKDYTLRHFKKDLLNL